jgi:hypothetical protein
LSKNVEDEKAEEEDWKKVSNQAVTFTEFVNCDNVMTTALLSVEDIGDAASEDKDVREESDDLDEEHPVLFGEAVAAFETARHYMTSFQIDDASMR